MQIPHADQTWRPQAQSPRSPLSPLGRLHLSTLALLPYRRDSSQDGAPLFAIGWTVPKSSGTQPCTAALVLLSQVATSQMIWLVEMSTLQVQACGARPTRGRLCASWDIVRKIYFQSTTLSVRKIYFQSTTLRWRFVGNQRIKSIYKGRRSRVRRRPHC